MERPLKIDLDVFMKGLDIKSRKIIWYLRRYGHVKLSELTGLIRAGADMETLYRLNEVINPAAMRIFGQPLLKFYKSRIDQATGKRVLFHWWLLDTAEESYAAAGNKETPLVDIFDEEDRIVIVSEVSPSLILSDRVKVEQRNGTLSITLYKLQNLERGDNYGA
jgi:HSP20 family molecular chaperone IbpA